MCCLKHIISSIYNNMSWTIHHRRYNTANNVTETGGHEVGDVKLWPGAVSPTGWLLCDGSEYSVTNYANLYAIIGDVYSTPVATAGMFRVPDMRGRNAVGSGTGSYKASGYAHASGSSLINKPLGEMRGATYSSQIPVNTETALSNEGSENTFGNAAANIYNIDSPEIGEYTDGNATEGGNYAPYCVMNYVIKY